MQVIRDMSSSSSFWGAAWVFGCFPDVHIVCDMPIGCFAMMSLAVADYADAIPYLENLTPTVIREEDVINGTGQALKRTIDNLRTLGYLEGKRLVVLSSAESEMIGADHTNFLDTLDPDARFFWSHSLEQDEWAGRDRALVFLWREYGNFSPSDVPPLRHRVNILGPTLSCFNAPSDVHEVKRLITGVGGEINLVYPYESDIASTPRLADAAVNVVMYREFGETLAQELQRPYLLAPFGLQGTTDFLYELGSLLGTPKGDVDAFVEREKRTTLQPIWDMWRGPQSDWFSTVDCCIVAGRSYVDGLRSYIQGELGMNVVWSSGRPHKDDEPDSLDIRRRLHERPPAFVFGSINERIYLSEVNAKSRFIPSAFPGPIVRRAVGTPFMGYSGATYILQELANHLYDMVFAVLPVELIQREGPPLSSVHPVLKPEIRPGFMVWTEDATSRLNAELDQLPYLERFSSIRSWRKESEQAAVARGMQKVTLDVVEEILSRMS
jgi:3,8-divinyl chlorophyllide a/chlorophyllide a reductase subunit Z